MYLTGNLYAQFLKEKAIPEVKKVFGISFSDAIWQDDQDKKQRMQIVLDVIKENFSERIETEDGDAKFADCWPIENVWVMLKEKMRGIDFCDEDSLIQCVNKEWKNITLKQCQRMMNKIPERLLKVIKNNGAQIH